MDLIDSHCHLGFDPLADRIDAVIRRSREAGVIGWITVGTELDQARNAVGLAHQFEGMYAAVGMHPHEARLATTETVEGLHTLAKDSKVVAIGEIGLDFHYNLSPQDVQRDAFVRQLDLACDLGLPVIIHTREAFGPTLEILDRFASMLKRVVMHCFTGSIDQAVAALDRGFFLSFSGVVTFRNAEDLRNIVKQVPLDRLLVETDCPYLTPEPVRKHGVNEPALMVHTARMLAELKQVEFAEICQVLTANASRFFDLEAKA